MILSDLSRRSLLAISLGSVVGAQATLAQESTPAGTEGDWPMPGANPGRTGAITAPGLTTTPTERWRIPFYLSQQAAPGGPLVAGDTLLLFDWWNERLNAYDLATGKDRWQADVGSVAGDGVEFAGAIGDGLVCVWGTFGEASSSDAGAPAALFALDLVTGQEIWRVGFSLDTYATFPIILDSRLVVATDGPEGAIVVAYDLASGSELWRVSFSPGVESIAGSVAGTAGSIFVPIYDYEVSDNILVALDLTGGAERWRASGADFAYYGLVVADGAVYFAGVTDEAVSMVLKAVDAETGTTLWEFTADDWPEAESLAIMRVAAAHELVYLDTNLQIQSDEGYTWLRSILALDQATGTQQWRVDGMATPVIAADVLYASTVKFDFPTDPIDMPTFPALTGDFLLAYSYNLLTDPDALVSLSAITGAELWRLPGDVRIMCAGSDLLLVESHEAVIAYGAPL